MSLIQPYVFLCSLVECWNKDDSGTLSNDFNDKSCFIKIGVSIKELYNVSIGEGMGFDDDFFDDILLGETHLKHVNIITGGGIG